ncbi:MAG: GNAT family N-acetyltransferase [Planctomycetes bacterium]|nr:GNAT family N-acetyltransferase [Planctomycetota bacterium]
MSGTTPTGTSPTRDPSHPPGDTLSACGAPRRWLTEVDLVGERVRLRAHRREDARPAFELLHGQEEILRWLVWDGPASPEELEDYYAHGLVTSATARDLRLAIEERASGALAGSLAVRFLGHAAQGDTHGGLQGDAPGDTQGDIGYWVGLPHQRRGLAREAIALAAELAFRHLGAHALYAWVFVGNLASRRVLERNGFTLAHTAPGRVSKRGVRVDEWHFVLLLSEWRRFSAGVRLERECVTWESASGPDGFGSPTRAAPPG